MTLYHVQLTTFDQMAENDARGYEVSLPAGQKIIDTFSPTQAIIIAIRDLRALDIREYGCMYVYSSDNEDVYAYADKDSPMWEIHIEYDCKPVTRFVV